MLLAHTTGWPVVEGGSGQLIAAMTAELAELGGTVTTGTWIERLTDLPPATAVAARRHAAPTAGDGRRPAAGGLPAGDARGSSTGRGSARSTGRWTAPFPGKARPAGKPCTVHVGGTIAEVARSEAEVNAGRHPERPFCLVDAAGRGRPQPGARGQARAVGLLPRAARFRRRHDRTGSRRRSSGSRRASVT